MMSRLEYLRWLESSDCDVWHYFPGTFPVRWITGLPQ